MSKPDLSPLAIGPLRMGSGPIDGLLRGELRRPVVHVLLRLQPPGRQPLVLFAELLFAELLPVSKDLLRLSLTNPSPVLTLGAATPPRGDGQT